MAFTFSWPSQEGSTWLVGSQSVTRELLLTFDISVMVENMALRLNDSTVSVEHLHTHTHTCEGSYAVSFSDYCLDVAMEAEWSWQPQRRTVSKAP